MALRRRLSGDDDTLRREIIEAEEERRAFLAEHELLREDAHERVDQGLAACRERALQLAAEFRHLHGWPLERVDGKVRAFASAPLPQPTFEVAALFFAGNSPEFRKLLQSAVDGPALHGSPAFSELSRKEYDAKLEKLGQAITDRQKELARREVERRREELEAELQALGGVADEGEKVTV